MKTRRSESEFPVAGRKSILQGPTAIMAVVGAMAIWGCCFLGSSSAATPNAGGVGALDFGTFGSDAFAFVPLAELAPVGSDSSKESDSKDADNSADNSAASAQKNLEYHPVPEPQTWVIAVSGLATLVVLQRLRRRPGMRKF